MNIMTQNKIDEHGRIVEKDRLTHDKIYKWFSGTSVNIREVGASVGSVRSLVVVLGIEGNYPFSVTTVSGVSTITFFGGVIFMVILSNKIMQNYRKITPQKR